MSQDVVDDYIFFIKKIPKFLMLLKINLLTNLELPQS